MEPTAEATFTVSYTCTIKPEPNVTVEEKEAAMKQYAVDQAAAIANNYDWGIKLEGTVSSTISETVPLDYEKPEYEEE